MELCVTTTTNYNNHKKQDILKEFFSSSSASDCSRKDFLDLGPGEVVACKAANRKPKLRRK